MSNPDVPMTIATCMLSDIIVVISYNVAAAFVVARE